MHSGEYKWNESYKNIHSFFHLLHTKSNYKKWEIFNKLTWVYFVDNNFYLNLIKIIFTLLCTWMINIQQLPLILIDHSSCWLHQLINTLYIISMSPKNNNIPLSVIFWSAIFCNVCKASSPPNIILIVADDLGKFTNFIELYIYICVYKSKEIMKFLPHLIYVLV